MKSWCLVCTALLLLVGALFFGARPFGLSFEKEGQVASTKSEQAMRSGELESQGSRGEHEEAHLEDLDPRYHSLVLRMEQEYRAWWNEVPHWEYGPICESDWDKLSREEVRLLSDDELQALAAWILGWNSGHLIEMAEYSSALFSEWGRRESEDAFEVMRERLQGSEDGEKRSLEEKDRQAVGQVLAGWAKVDAVAAWEALRGLVGEDSAFFPDSESVVSAILSEYAAVDFTGALGLLEDFELFQIPILRGILRGVPDDQDWLELAGQLTESVSETWTDFLVVKEVAESWFLKEPTAALKWYGTKSEVVEEGVGSSMPDDNAVSLQLLFEVSSQSGREGQRAIVAWLQEVAGENDEVAEQFLKRALFERKTGASFAPASSMGPDGTPLVASDYGVSLRGQPFLQELTALPQELSRAYFLEYVARIPARVLAEEDSFAELTFNDSNRPLEAARSLLPEIQLTPEERVEAEAALDRVVTQEEENRAKTIEKVSPRRVLLVD